MTKGEFNVRPRNAPKGPTREAVCGECGQSFSWQKVGDLPDRCGECSKRHNTRINGTRSQANPWGDDLQPVDDFRDLYEVADKLLHWSPSLRRWLINDGNRWYLTQGEHDVYRVALQLMTNKSERKKGRVSRFRPATESFISSFKAWCESRATQP